MVNKQTIEYLHGTMFQLKERVKSANDNELRAIGEVLEDIANLIHVLEGNKSVFFTSIRGGNK